MAAGDVLEVIQAIILGTSPVIRPLEGIGAKISKISRTARYSSVILERRLWSLDFTPLSLPSERAAMASSNPVAVL